jgi:hypothetical protein
MAKVFHRLFRDLYNLGEFADYPEEGLESKIENAIESKSEMNEDDSDFESEYGMSEEEFKMRNIVDKIIGNTSVLSMLGIVPAAMMSGGGAAVAAGVTALVAYLLKDAAWYNKKDTSGQMPGSGVRQGGYTTTGYATGNSGVRQVQETSNLGY